MHGQATAMTDAAVTTEVHQSLNVHRCFAAEITLDNKLRHLGANAFHFGFATDRLTLVA